MLQNMRESFTGKFAFALLVLIALSFVFVGLNYSFIGSTYAAKVDGEEISAAELEANYRQALANTPALAQYTGPLRVQVRRTLLDQLIAAQLVNNFLNEHGYRIGDEQLTRNIQRTPEFQVGGRFDMDTYMAFLAARGYTPERFEPEHRNSLRQRQLELSVGATALVSPAEYRRYLNLGAQQRVVTVGKIDQSAIADELVVTDDMVEAYYNDNPALFQIPETVDVEFVQISLSDVAENIAVSQEALLQAYEDNKGRYLQDEQRAASHILITFGDDAEAARARAEEALARVQAGEDFAAVAADMSDDTLTAAAGGSLGTLTQSQFISDDLGDVVFEMGEGDVAGPVETDFGFHVVRLDEILERGPLPLDQVRGELLSELRADQANDRYRDLERAMSDAVFDSADMQTIAAAVDGVVEMASGITRQGGEPFGSNQAVIDAVFDEMVLSGEQTSEVIELDAESAAVFRVVKYNEASRQPLADVREQIVAVLESEQAETILAARADEALASIEAGDEFATAAEAQGFTVTEPQLLTRGDQDVDQALMFEVFTAPKPGEAGPVTGSTRLLDGSYAIYSLAAVLPGRPESIPLAQRDEGKLMLAQQSGINDYQAFVRYLYENADVVINEDVLAAEDTFQ